MRRVLIIRPGAMGDTLMIIPALRDLGGKVSVAFAGRQPGLHFIRPHVDRAMDLEGQGWHPLFQDTQHEISLPVSGMDIVIAFFSREEETIRRNLRRSLPGADIHVFPSFPRKDDPFHVALYLARCLASAGLPVDPARAVSRAYQDGVCPPRSGSEGQGRIVLHPGSGSPKKNHPPAFWIELSRGLRRDPLFKGFPQVVLLGPAEASLRHYFSENLPAGDTAIVTSFDADSLQEALQDATLLIGHDSGVTHLSGLRGVPTVALFKSSDPRQWAPLGPLVSIIEAGDPGPELIVKIIMCMRIIHNPPFKKRQISCEVTRPPAKPEAGNT